MADNEELLEEELTSAEGEGEAVEAETEAEASEGEPAAEAEGDKPEAKVETADETKRWRDEATMRNGQLATALRTVKALRDEGVLTDEQIETVATKAGLDAAQVKSVLNQEPAPANAQEANMERFQTSKYRPIVKMPPSLKAYLRQINDREGLLVHKGDGQPIKRWETAWRNARAKAKLGKKVNPYSIRHSVARWLRASGVPKWEIEGQLGHRALSTTDIYAPHAPEYLSQACAAIEKLMQEVFACQLRDAA